jgi:hypothetical protein
VDIEIDESDWPLLVIRWPRGVIVDADVDAFLRVSTEHLARRERFASFHDGVRATALDSRQRRRMADHVTTHRKELAEWHVAAAIFADSAVVRGIVTAINWLSPPPFPQRQFAVRADAEAWLRQMLRADAEARAR